MDQPGGPASDPGTGRSASAPRPVAALARAMAALEALWLTAGRENRSPENWMKEAVAAEFVEVHRLVKRFGGRVTAVDGLDSSVRCGEPATAGA